MGKKLAWLASALCMAWLLPAWALSLGGIQIHSRLNQPLTATIPIYPAPGEEIDENVKVRLASNEDYARAGLERLDFLSDLSFALDGPRVVVTSRRVAREPVIDLLLEVRWGGGRLLRQYTLLLDPESPGATPLAPFEPAPTPPPPAPPAPGVGGTPGAAGTASAGPSRAGAAPVESYSQGNVGGTRPRRSAAEESRAAQEPSAAAAQPAPSYPTTEAEPPRHAARQPAQPAQPRKYGPIKAGETPWSVASKLKPDDSVTVEQVIIALFQWNPTAFGSNLSTFRTGSTLRVPDIEVIRRVDPVVAKARIAEARSRVEEPVRPAAPPRTPTASAAAPQAPPESTSPKAETPVRPAPTPPPAAESAPAAAPEAPASTPAAQETPAAKPEAAPETPATETSAGTPAGEAAPPPEPKVEHPRPRSGFESWLYPAAAIAAALFLFWLIWRLARRPRSPGDDFAIDEPTLGAPAPVVRTPPPPPRATIEPARAEPRAEPAAAPPRTPPKPPEPERLVMPEPPPPQPPPAAPPAAAPKATTPSLMDTALTDTRQIDLEGGDALAEADFHLAYGLYDEAILLLTQALTRDPARTDVRTKLAEAYFSANRAQEFMDTARGLRGQLDAAGWEKIAVLGRQLFPSEPLFGGTGKVQAAPSGEAAQAAPRPAMPAGSAAPMTPPPSPAKTPEPASLPFELEPLLDLDAPLDTPAARAGDSGAGVDLESRLNLDDPALGGDEATTKLDLARAYIDLGDNDMARGLLSEVIQQGSSEQRQAAEELMRRLPA